jgi:hypothetical protein
MIIYYKCVSIIKINNFKFSVGYHSVTELEATLLIKYINYFTQNDHHITAKIQHCSISKVAFDLFTDILFAVGLLSTGNRKHIIFLLLYAIYHSTHLHTTFIHIVDGAKLNLKLL